MGGGGGLQGELSYQTDILNKVVIIFWNTSENLKSCFIVIKMHDH